MNEGETQEMCLGSFSIEDVLGSEPLNLLTQVRREIFFLLFRLSYRWLITGSGARPRSMKVVYYYHL